MYSMRLMFAVVFFAALLVPLVVSDNNISVNVVYVHGPTNTSGIEASCRDVPSSDCYDINNCLSEFSNFTTIQFCTATVYLQRILSFKGHKNISFIGATPATKLICTCQEGGLTFTEVENLSITGLSISNCGNVWITTTITSLNYQTARTSSAVLISDSTNVFLADVQIINSNGSGIAIVKTDGTVTIENCAFKGNKVNGSKSMLGGGGMYLEFGGGRKFANASVYTINNCKFEGNNASSIYSSIGNVYDYNNRSHFRGLGRGGGLAIFIRGDSENNRITVSKCTFENNSAVWGGGVIATFHNYVRNNSLVVKDCVFRGNIAYRINGSVDGGGGGAHIGYHFQNFTHPPEGNVITFRNCSFVNNVAFATGGGVSFFSGYSSSIDALNQIVFLNCTWFENIARYGSAIDISPHRWMVLSIGYLPIPLFENCTFTRNFVTDFERDRSKFWDVKIRGRGAFLAAVFSIKFAGETTFTGNNGSAIFAMSTMLDFCPGSNATFLSNSGPEGGAIALIGFSGIQIRDNSVFTFKKNSALVSGGAIYHSSIDKHDFISSRSCFIQYVGYTSLEDRNVSFIFDGNYAELISTNYSSKLAFGHSIFATTVLSCAHRCTDSAINKLINYDEIFKCIGNYTFKNTHGYEISTSGSFFKFVVNNDDELPVNTIPGKDVILPFNTADNLGNTVNEVYHVTVQKTIDSDIRVDEAHSYFSSERVKLFGKPDATARVSLAKIGFTEVTVTFDVRMLKCPPGFVLITDRSNNLELQKCICSTDTHYNFTGVLYCNHTLFRAYIQHGYWFGYENGSAIQENLLSSYCPPGYCFQKEIDNFHLLTATASHEDLDNLVCGKRSGIVCGFCKEGFSVFYLSEFFKCERNSKCHLGWLFYILSDIVPVTFIFLIVMFFNISFTSGPANSFIFFAQVIDSLSVTGSGFIILGEGTYQTARALQSVYKFFNFDFFNTDDLSFCLWKGATTLDILTFKFVTVSYAFLLVLLTILCMRTCNVYRRFPCLRQSSVQSSLIHGLSAFLVMCYAQCTKVAIRILDPVHLYSQGNKLIRTVVFLQGNIGHMQVEHLPYAIPALFFILTLVIIPPFILICYPYYKKVFAYGNLDESRVVRCGSRVFPIERMKPLIDAFQGCFKDNFRFFAGLQFVYRVTILSSVFSPSVNATYSLSEVQLIAMLLLHAIAQPYKKRWHNIVDALILFDLALINKMTLFNYNYSLYSKTHKELIETVSIIQIVLIQLPLLYMITYVIVCIIAKLQKQFWKREPSEDIPLDAFPPRLEQISDSENSSESEGDYQLYNDETVN